MKVQCLFNKMVPIGDLKPHPKNRNQHPKDQIERLAEILKYQGWRYPIKVSKRSGFITSGHGRLAAALHNGWAEVPVNYQEYDDELQEFADLQADNAIALWAELDLQAINLDMQEFDRDFNIDLLGIKDFELELPQEPNDKDPDEVPENVETRCKFGDVWQLGEHRLMCGDSTDEATVDKLMDGETPLMMVTDPPYGVNYDPSWRARAAENGNIKSLGPTSEGKVKNDDNASWEKVYALSKAQVAYVWHGDPHAKTVQSDLEAAGFICKCQIIWNKPAAVFGRGDYHWKHEPCWYAVKKGKNHNWCGDRKQNTVWDIAGMNPFGGSKDEADERTGHGTQKPIMCMQKPLENNSKKNDLIYDPFGGSGSTLIACEKTKRKCYMMEIDPHYCNVILARWETYTGQKAVKLI